MIHFHHILTNIRNFLLWVSVILMRVRWYLFVFIFFFSPMALMLSTFSYICWVLLFLLLGTVLNVLCPFFNQIFFCCCWVLSCWYTWDINPLSDRWLANVFPILLAASPLYYLPCCAEALEFETGPFSVTSVACALAGLIQEVSPFYTTLEFFFSIFFQKLHRFRS